MKGAMGLFLDWEVTSDGILSWDVPRLSEKINFGCDIDNSCMFKFMSKEHLLQTSTSRKTLLREKESVVVMQSCNSLTYMFIDISFVWKSNTFSEWG